MLDNTLDVIEDFGPAPETGGWLTHRRAVVAVHQADRTLRALVLKLRHREAKRLEAALVSLTALSMAPSADGVIVRGWAGARDLGIITVLPRVDADVNAVVVSKGGARRSHYWDHEILCLHAVAIRVPQGEGNAVVGWPEASATLLRFISPLRIQDMPPRMAAEVVRMASTVWTGVVLADHEGDGDVLEQARRAVCERGAPEALVDLLVDRKRKTFGNDPRVMAIDAVDMDGDEVRLTVQATIPKP